MAGKSTGTNATSIQWATQAEEKAIPRRSHTFFIQWDIPEVREVVYNTE